jgi:hypothetical protein
VATIRLASMASAGAFAATFPVFVVIALPPPVTL